MKHPTVSFALLLAVALMAAGCAGNRIQPPESPKKAETSINPTQSFEDCIEMTKGNSMLYSFKSSAPLNFNIHFHEGEAISYPVERKNTSAEEGEFLPDRKQYYCMMWTNIGSEAVKVEYSYNVKKKET